MAFLSIYILFQIIILFTYLYIHQYVCQSIIPFLNRRGSILYFSGFPTTWNPVSRLAALSSLALHRLDFPLPSHRTWSELSCALGISPVLSATLLRSRQLSCDLNEFKSQLRISGSSNITHLWPACTLLFSCGLGWTRTGGELQWNLSVLHWAFLGCVEFCNLFIYDRFLTVAGRTWIAHLWKCTHWASCWIVN